MSGVIDIIGAPFNTIKKALFPEPDIPPENIMAQSEKPMPEPEVSKSVTIQAAEEEQRKRAATSRRKSGTLLTGPSGLEDEPVTRKTLLGQ